MSARFVLPCALALIAVALALPSPASASSSRARDVGIMISAINQVRAKYGRPSVRRARRLGRSAGGYSQSLMRRGVFGHSGLARAGRFRVKGEALERHSGRNRAALAAFRRLMRSPGHRQVILDSRMRLVGAGVARGRFRGARSVIWVLHFAGR